MPVFLEYEGKFIRMEETQEQTRATGLLKRLELATGKT